MAQLSWRVLDASGGSYHVGLYHGDRSKHLLVQIEGKPIIIDFRVKKDKQYTFYTGEELCHLDIKQEFESFSYSLQTNTSLQTPLNQARKMQSKRYFWITIGLALSFICAIVILSIAYFST